MPPWKETLYATAASLMVAVTVTATCLFLSVSAVADDRYAPIKDPLVVKECGACHLAFQPQMLPGKSWARLMDGLEDHFGEDASLAQDTRENIRRYLVDHAADAGWMSGRFMRGLTDADAPLRITETPYWIREHEGEVSPRAWSDPKVKTKANCLACHPRADRGDYDD